MNTIQELADILTQRITKTPLTLPHANVQNAAEDAFSIRFNIQQFFVVLKSLNEIFANYYNQEHQSDTDIDNELLKFTYLGQIHLTRLSVNATLFAENIKYLCFELAIFYLASLKLANENHFVELTKSLSRLKKNIFQTNNTLAMIAITKIAFEAWYLNERDLYEQLFRIYLISSRPANITYTMNIDQNDMQETRKSLLALLKHAKSDTYQKQLAFKLTEYLNLDSIFVECSSRSIMTDFLSALYESRSDKDKQQTVAFREQYQSHLFYKLWEKRSSLQLINSEDLSCCDFSKINLTLSVFNHVTFISEGHQTKLPPHITYCIFQGVQFTDPMMCNSSFKHCFFIKCEFNNLSIKTKFTGCTFDECEFNNTTIAWTEFNNCIIKSCGFANNSWYRVLTVNTEISDAKFFQTDIHFSNFIKSEIKYGLFFKVNFEGTNLNSLFSECRWPYCSLGNAIYINDIVNDAYLAVTIYPTITARFNGAQNIHNILVNTAQIEAMINQITRPAALNAMPCEPAYFRKVLGWILCGVDRVTEYCHEFEKDPENFSLFDKFTKIDLLAAAIPQAVKPLNKFLTLTDRCHLTLMTSALLRNNIFHNFDQYQQLTKYNPAYYPQNDKNCLREMLFIIHELPKTIKYIKEVMSRIREKKEAPDKQQLGFERRSQAQ